jgi:serine/threonine protein kinase
MFASQKITPSLTLVRQLGEGGMGSVWAAHHDGLGVEVAVKFVSAALASNATAVARFKREATAAAQIGSAHVVRMFDHGVAAEGVPYIVMELLTGEDLGDRIDRAGPLPVGDVKTIVQQTCKALGKAHQLGLVHRDIKPDNIFLTHEDEELFVKVLDFGVAKRTDSGSMEMTSTGAMMGTPYYMSPEQVLSAKHVDHRADLWALAVLAYHALTGKRPFDGDTLGALCVRINDARFVPANELRADLPHAFGLWFARALARDPAERYQSAKEFAAAFAAAADAPLDAALPAPVIAAQPALESAGLSPAPARQPAPATALRWVETFQPSPPAPAPLPAQTAPAPASPPAPDRLGAIAAQGVSVSTVDGASSTLSEEKLRPSRRVPVLPLVLGGCFLLAIATGLFLGGRALLRAVRGAPASSESAAVALPAASGSAAAQLPEPVASTAATEPIPSGSSPLRAPPDVPKPAAGPNRTPGSAAAAPSKAPTPPAPGKQPSKSSKSGSVFDRPGESWGF